MEKGNRAHPTFEEGRLAPPEGVVRTYTWSTAIVCGKGDYAVVVPMGHRNAMWGVIVIAHVSMHRIKVEHDLEEERGLMG